tara:strand:+ start:267 stop:545 length:279 start_codon:yes stop_codon:yes gene_type:complete
MKSFIKKTYYKKFNLSSKEVNDKLLIDWKNFNNYYIPRYKKITETEILLKNKFENKVNISEKQLQDSYSNSLEYNKAELGLSTLQIVKDVVL